MERKELTLEEANALSNDHQGLLGHYIDPYLNRYKYIRYVVPAPFDEKSRQIFMYLWNQYGCSQKALSHYTGNAYDVIVVAGEPRVEDYPPFVDLNSFLYERASMPMATAHNIESNRNAAA